LKAEPRFYHQARIAPDGNSVALGVLDPSDIWRWDFARETMTLPNRVHFGRQPPSV